MEPWYGYHALCGPGAGKLMLVSLYPAWIGFNVEFGDRALGKPLSVSCDDLGYIGWLPFNRKLPWPGESGTTPFARFGKRAAIFVHFFFRQLTLNTSRQI